MAMAMAPTQYIGWVPQAHGCYLPATDTEQAIALLPSRAVPRRGYCAKKAVIQGMIMANGFPHENGARS